MRTLSASTLRAFIFVSTLLCASEGSARADVLPPENAACDGAKAGGACKNAQTGATGTCEAVKCTQRDYANWDRDSSTGPPEIQVDCLRCSAGGGNTTSDAKDGGSGNGGGSGDGAGCSATGAARGAAPWLLAMAAAAVVSARRKRKPL